MTTLPKILIISGPTATGKTSLAVSVAKKYSGELISADSRQVYRGLDIGVGKDHPPGTPIHLIDLISPDRIFSVAEFQTLAFTKIKELVNKNKLPIVVGGSGFYIDALINPHYDSFTVKPKSWLRLILNVLPVSVLKKIFISLNKKTFLSLNNSDVNNPRRLIRKIELSLFPRQTAGTMERLDYDILHLSLTAANHFLFKRIDDRVASRLKMGHLRELSSLLINYSWSSPGLKISAYQVFKNYFNKKITLKESQKLWLFAEHADARRQKTWFRRYDDAVFINVNRPGWQKSALMRIDKWYNNL